MCIILLAYKVHPDYPLVILANRDEFHAREASPAHPWADLPGVHAGRDLTAGGTWLGVTPNGRFAAVTNYRDFRLTVPSGAPSRGELVTGFLQSQHPESWLRALESDGIRYAGFNLIAGDGGRLWHLSNQGGSLQEITPGFHGLSNHLLNTPWPKVTRGKDALQAQLMLGLQSPEHFFGILADQESGDDHLLPDTGRDIEFERRVSPIFIRDHVYGTRCSTVYVHHRSGVKNLIERSFDPDGSVIGQVQWDL